MTTAQRAARHVRLTTEVSTMTTIEMIAHLNPCSEAQAWMEQNTDPETAWQTCIRGDWMVWLLGRLSPAFDAELRTFARWCALSCLHNWPDPPQVVLDWLMTGDEQYRSAAESAAWSAAESAAWSAARSAARSAAWSAAFAAESAARSAAGSAASAAWSATFAAAAESAQADKIREMVSWEQIQTALR